MIGLHVTMILYDRSQCFTIVDQTTSDSHAAQREGES